MSKTLKTFILLLLTFVSCRPDGVISKKEMVPILVKICLNDAALNLKDYREKYLNIDSLDCYSSTLKSYGYTKAQFDSSLKYYSRNPKELDAIYDKVISELSKMEIAINEEAKSQPDTVYKDAVDIWNLKQFYNLTLDSPQDLISFDVPVKGLGTYILSYDIQMFLDDESIDPEIKAFFYYDDKTPEGNVSEYKTSPYIKDGLKRHVELKFELKDKLVTNFMGQVLDYHNSNTKFRSHAVVSNIRLLYQPLKEISEKPLKLEKK